MPAYFFYIFAESTSSQMAQQDTEAPRAGTAGQITTVGGLWQSGCCWIMNTKRPGQHQQQQAPLAAAAAAQEYAGVSSDGGITRSSSSSSRVWELRVQRLQQVIHRRNKCQRRVQGVKMRVKFVAAVAGAAQCIIIIH